MMKVQDFYDPNTNTLTYVVHKDGNSEAIVVDPVLDFDPASGKIHTESAELVVAYLREHNLKAVMILETHAHADHLSGSQFLQEQYPQAEITISERITAVQEVFAKLFNMDVPTDGSAFDRLVKDNEEFTVAGLKLRAIPTPGHTPACTSYLIEDALFTGDSMFMPDQGVGRCDFPKGDARALFRSITQNVFSLPDSTRVFVGHDYQPDGRELRFESTVGEQKEKNIFINASTQEDEFVTRREARDKSLAAPRLLLPSIQVNIMAGRLPEPENNGMRYLKIPLRAKG